MRNIKKVLVEKKSGRKFYVKDLDDDFHSEFGVISSKDFSNTHAFSSKGNDFLVLDPQFPDLWENLKRGPQILQKKDIGMILAYSGVNSKSRVVDAGGGSGSLCLSLANVCKEVTAYEVNPEHCDVILKNIKLFGVENLSLRQQSVYDGILEKDLDLITLDLPEPWRVIDHAIGSLVDGGFLVVYLPNLTQVKTFLDFRRGTKIKVLEVVELLKRNWKITDKIMRPEFEMLGHTGFLIFCRKL